MGTAELIIFKTSLCSTRRTPPEQAQQFREHSIAPLVQRSALNSSRVNSLIRRDSAKARPSSERLASLPTPPATLASTRPLPSQSRRDRSSQQRRLIRETTRRSSQIERASCRERV